MVFDVLHEAWIPAMKLDGSIKKTSPMELIQNAHEYRRLAFDKAMFESSVLVFLLVFIMDALHESYEEADGEMVEAINTRRLFSAKRFSAEDLERIRAYVDACQHDGVSFDLFDPVHPFLQMWGDPEQDKDMNIVPVADFVPHTASGTNLLFISRIPESQFSITPTEFLIYLITNFRYVLQGGAGWISGILEEPPTYIMVEGSTLYETFILNMIQSARAGDSLTESGVYGVPFYRRMNEIVPGKKAVWDDLYILDSLLYPVRRYRAILGEDGRIWTIWKGHGFSNKTVQNVAIKSLRQDPYKAYMPIKTKDGPGFKHICFSSAVTSKDHWRGLLWEGFETLVLPDELRQGSYEPLVIKTARNRLEPGEHMTVVVYATETNKASYKMDTRFAFRMPKGLFSDEPGEDANYRNYVYSMIAYAKKEQDWCLKTALERATIAFIRPAQFEYASPKTAKKKSDDSKLPDAVKVTIFKTLVSFSCRISTKFFEVLGLMGQDEERDWISEWKAFVYDAACEEFNLYVDALNTNPMQRMQILNYKNFLKQKE